MWNKIVSRVAGFVLGGVAVYSVLILTLPSPTRVITARELDGIVVKGERMELVFALKDAQRICPTKIDRQIWQWRDVEGVKTQYIVPLPAESTPITRLDAKAAIIALAVPNGITSGDWFYGSRSTFACTWLGWPLPAIVTHSPDVKLVFLDDRASVPHD